MKYEDALEYIHGIYWKSKKSGLDRINELLDLLGHPEKDLKVVHVSGTNGKGSTCAITEAILREAGYKTALCISPYISRFNERMQINGVPIPDDTLCEVTEYVKSYADKMENQPTEFELVCAITMEYFKRENPDYTVIEVGMGGRIDATNVFKKPLVTAITAIGLDHTQYLGDTPEKIAIEKCGIVKQGCPVVCYGTPESIKPGVNEYCSALDAPVTYNDFSDLKILENNFRGQRFAYHGNEYFISLLGEHQCENAITVLNIIEALRAQDVNIPDGAVSRGFANVKWPGRFEYFPTSPVSVVDGAHNPHGVHSAVTAAHDYFKDMPITLVIGVLVDKDFRGMIEELNTIAARYVITSPPNPRALAADELANQFRQFGKPVKVVENPADAALYALETTPGDGAVLCLGSLYMVGDIRDALSKASQEN